MPPPRVGPDLSLSPAHSSILNLPGESTLRRDFLRLQLANKERSEALRRQQLEQQQRENEEHKRQLLAERQKRIEEQKEQRRRLEEVRARPGTCGPFLGAHRGPGSPPEAAACLEHFTPELRRRWPRALYQQAWCDLGVVTSERQVKGSAPSSLTQASPS